MRIHYLAALVLVAALVARADDVAIDALVSQLDSDDPAARNAAERKLIEMGPSAETRIRERKKTAGVEANARIGRILVRFEETRFKGAKASLVRTIEPGDGRVISLALSQDGEFCAVAGKTVTFVDLKDGSGKATSVNGIVRAGSAGSEILVESREELAAWDAKAGTRTSVICAKEWTTPEVHTVLSPDRKWAAFRFYGPDNMGVVLRPLGGGKDVRIISDPENTTSICWLADSARIAVAYCCRDHNGVRVLDTGGKVLFDEATSAPSEVLADPSMKHLLWEDWDLKRKEDVLKACDSGHLGPGETLLAPGDGRFEYVSDDLAITFGVFDCGLWFMPTATKVKSFDINHTEHGTVSRDGMTFAVLVDKKVKVFRIDTTDTGKAVPK